MAGIRKEVKLELTNEEREILRKASQILDELAEEDGADIVFDMCESLHTGFWYISGVLASLVENSN